MVYCTTHPSPVGRITLACDDDAIVGLWMEGQKYILGSIAEPMIPKDDCPLLTAAKQWLDRYFSGEKPAADELALRPIGGEFRQEVWAMLRQIPYGEVITYAEIAKKIAHRQGRKSMSAQAVGGAVGHNPISILIPCHRVVGSNGCLTGYAGGLEAKKKLLELEGVDQSKLFWPKKGNG